MRTNTDILLRRLTLVYSRAIYEADLTENTEISEVQRLIRSIAAEVIRLRSTFSGLLVYMVTEDGA